MDKASAQDYVLDRALEITDNQFEQLCKIVIEQSEETRELRLTPFRQDGGIDIHSVIDRELFFVRLGFQVKHYSESNKVSSPEMQKFKGALGDNNYKIGTIITTSDFTGPALESAELDFIRAINGRQLAKIMVEGKLGVEQRNTSYIEDEDFWDIFSLAEEDDLLRSDDVPQADNLGILSIVLGAIHNGFDVKQMIAEYLERETNESWSERQADYYALAAWPLGLVHKDTEKEYRGTTVRQWNLSQAGEKYVLYLDSGQEQKAQDLLLEHIRDMEVSRRIVGEIKAEGSMSKKELGELINRETRPSGSEGGLGEVTSERRATTLGKWISELPEVGVSHQRSGTQYEYIASTLTDW